MFLNRTKKKPHKKKYSEQFHSKISAYFILVCLIDMSSVSGYLRVEPYFSVAVRCPVKLWVWSLVLLLFLGKQFDHSTSLNDKTFL